MKILFTGASSFTGYWFVRQLAENGHDVWATFTKENADVYDGIRGERVRSLMDQCHPIWACHFGSDRFIQNISSEKSWDLFCHHAADVRDYTSSDFDINAAVAQNTRNIRQVIEMLQANACNHIVLTGSVFEQNEGAGESPMRAFSPYGLSKGLTAEVFRFWSQVTGIDLGKFVIPNPFGPYEEHRFTSYLVKTWMDKKIAGVKTPAYTRDNIHVSLLAKSYARFCESTKTVSGFTKINPSGYIESQGSFAGRFADAMRTRFNLPCEVEFGEQTTFDEPNMRVNTDRLDPTKLLWDESKAWDDIADFYLGRHSK